MIMTNKVKKLFELSRHVLRHLLTIFENKPILKQMILLANEERDGADPEE